MASLQAERLAQLRTMRPEDIDTLMVGVRRAGTVPALQRHFDRHGPGLGARTAEDYYLHRFQQHLEREDLRIFTHLRPRGRVPLWEFIAPDTGTTVLYNERRRSIWSFFRPANAQARMHGVQTRWVEVIRTPAGWQFVADWIWP